MAQRSYPSPHERLASASLLAPGFDEKITAVVFFGFREPGRREARAAFFSFGLGVGRGWKEFEMDCPTFLKKSPTGSALTQRPLKRNKAAIGKQTQRESMRRLSE